MIELTLSAQDVQGILPLLVATGFALIILMLDAFQRPGTSRGYLSYFATLGLVLTGLSAYVLWQQLGDMAESYHVESGRFAIRLFDGMVYLDSFGQALTFIFVISGILTCLLAPEFLKSHGVDKGEFYALVLFAVVGMILVAIAGNLMAVFLGLETMSISVYVMAGFFRNKRESAEASLKYLILGALATGILLFGMALVYGATRSLELQEIGRIYGGGNIRITPALQSILPESALQADNMVKIVTEPDGLLVPIAFLGMALVLVGLLFKVGTVPFHMWVPDVYTGSPTPAVGFMATAVKAAGFAALLRVFLTAFFDFGPRISGTGWVPIVFVLCLLTMIVGNLGAIVQNRLKRMLAYSSIAHAGYILVAFTASGYFGRYELHGETLPGEWLNQAVVFYLVAYTFGTAGAFGVLSYLGRKGESVETYEDLNELGYKYPWIGVAMTIFMLSAAGIPPTAGFVAKFLVFKAAVEAAGTGGPAPALMITLAAVGILVSVAGVYYYLKVVVHLYMHRAVRTIRALRSRSAGFAIAICAAATLSFGILPQIVKTRADNTITGMADTEFGPRARDLPLPAPPEPAAEAELEVEVEQ